MRAGILASETGSVRFTAATPWQIAHCNAKVAPWPIDNALGWSNIPEVTIAFDVTKFATTGSASERARGTPAAPQIASQRLLGLRLGWA